MTQGPASAAELTRALGVSQPTVSRAIRRLEDQRRVLRVGATRGARYALRRDVGALGSAWPVYRVDADGRAHELGHITAIAREGWHADLTASRARGFFDALPYWIQDARPAGYLGRAVPARYPELDLPARVVDWTGAHFLAWLTQRGGDVPGDLVVGAEAMDRHLAGQDAPPAVPRAERATAYPACAAAAVRGAPPGSSAHGEHPKFGALVVDDERRTHVLVKFSPLLATAAGRRWGDLLHAEHLAHEVLIEHGVPASRSQVFSAGDRVFLECERFDRLGAAGRRGAVSLYAVDAARYGLLDSWTAAADRLAADGLLAERDRRRLRLLDAFGTLIANTDRHFGNVTLFDDLDGPLELAPVYDMLPMLHAPQDDPLPTRDVAPVHPRTAWLAVWPEATALARRYWTRVAGDARIGIEFRAIAERHLAALHA